MHHLRREFFLHFSVILHQYISVVLEKYLFQLLSFLYLLRRRVLVIIAFLSCLLMKEDWLHLTCFSYVRSWILRTFEEMYLNFSNSPGRAFLRDNSWRRSAQNDVLSKWLKSLYWMILGLCFTWKVFKTVNVNLWKSDKLVP